MRENKRLSLHSIVWTVVWKTPLKRFSVLRNWSTGVWCTGHSASEARKFKRERDAATSQCVILRAECDNARAELAMSAAGPWHDVSERPQYEELVLVQAKGCVSGCPFITTYIHRENKEWPGDIVCWAEIREPKEDGDV